MKILQFKLGGEYEYNILYETPDEKNKLQTNDKPLRMLNDSINDVTSSALIFFRLTGVSAVFKQITFSSAENGIHYFVLELIIKTKENVFVTHSIKSEKLSLDSAESENLSLKPLIDQKNILIEKIIKLREEVEEYVSGARSQQELPLDGKEKNETSLFEDE